MIRDPYFLGGDIRGAPKIVNPHVVPCRLGLRRFSGRGVALNSGTDMRSYCKRLHRAASGLGPPGAVCA